MTDNYSGNQLWPVVNVDGVLLPVLYESHVKSVDVYPVEEMCDYLITVLVSQTKYIFSCIGSLSLENKVKNVIWYQHGRSSLLQKLTRYILHF
jgi:hypothetical protein